MEELTQGYDVPDAGAFRWVKTVTTSRVRYSFFDFGTFIPNRMSLHLCGHAIELHQVRGFRFSGSYSGL